MMPLPIVPDVDAYGSKARYEALADLIEVSALQRPSWNFEQFADYVRDRDWLRRDYDTFLVPSEDDDLDSLGSETDKAYEIAEGVFSVLADRAVAYAETYPFYFQAGRLRPHLQRSQGCKRYLALLATAILHAYGVPTGELRPQESAEELVRAALEAKGLIAIGLAATRRASSGFEETLREVGSALRLVTSSHSVIHSRHAHDLGVDVISRLDFGDDGYGKWIVIGQVTCGKSETWTQKARDPSRTRWRQLLCLSSNPIRFLAVPQEIPSSYRLEICEQNEHSVLLLDRRRLVRPDRRLLAVEEQLIELLGETRIEAFQ